MSPLPKRVALVTGANGISGNAIIEHLIRQPKTEWSRIVITSRKSLKNFWQDDRVEYFALDYLKPHDEIVAAMQPYCEDVTHAFYTSYVHTDDFSQLPVYNVPLWENFLKGLEEVAGTSLQRVCLQTGGKVCSWQAVMVAKRH
jgi:nucleoside-diphosphate-sugar epimerase